MSVLFRISRAIDAVNGLLGRAIAWLVLVMALLQFVIVIMRYVFGVGSLALSESVVYMHGLLFTVAAAYTLLVDKHVRVDIFYRDASPRRQALVNLLGTVFFLIPMCILILYVAYPYVARSWGVLEGSRETSGLPGVFLFKTVILVFAGMLIAQGISMVIRAGAALSGREPPGTGHAEISGGKSD